MPRSSTTALYTRVDNSFSNPVVGTTIDPTHADSFFDDVESAVNAFIATSASSVAIGTGSKTFTVAADVAGKAFLAGTFVHIFSRADTADYMFGSVTSYSTSTGALVVDVVTTGGSGTNTDWNIIQAGARGATGATGSAGATGDAAGFKYTFNSGTSGDPGSGKYLFNNAMFMSATALNISETDGDSQGLAALLATLDDGTSTNKCIVVFSKVGAVAVQIGYLTGTLTDNGGYDTFSFTPVLSSGTINNNDVCRLTAYRVGDKGADGAGAGDVVGPSSSVDGEIALFDSTTGKLLKRASTTGMLKAASGVIAAAVAGTDYLAPAAIGVTVQGYDADTLKADTADDLTAGFTSTSVDQGTKSSGTFTPAFATGNVQHYTNGGAHTLAPPSSGNGSIVIDMTNNGSAGAVTTSGFTKVTGDSLTTTNGHKFRFFITVGNAGSHLHKQAMQ